MKVSLGADFRAIAGSREKGGRRALHGARTVVAFANTCCIIASFSVWESLDMSMGVPCCAIATQARASSKCPSREGLRNLQVAGRRIW